MLKYLIEKNPQIPIHSVNDDAFKKYGRVLDMDTTEICDACQKLDYPESGSRYIASVEAFEQLNCADALREYAFGGCDAQIGITHGYSCFMNGLEYHKSSEINVAATPLVLLLGDLRDIADHRYDAGRVEAFYLEKGVAIEVYATTLHFCPCQVSDDGFSCVVVLPKGTNLELQEKSEDLLLFKKNKWILCHEKNQALIDRGVFPGIYGENYEIKY